MQRAGRDCHADDGWRRVGLRHVDNGQDARAIGLGAVHRNQFAAGRLDQFPGRFLAVRRGVFQNAVERTWRVLSGYRKA